MSDPGTNPYSRGLGDRLLSIYIQAYRLEHRTAYAFAFSGGTRLANTERAVVSLLRIPYSPCYDTSFILKYFKTEDFVQAHQEQVALEAASLHHAAEAFQRNNNICRAPRVHHVWPEENLIAMERIRGRNFPECEQAWWSKERMIRWRMSSGFPGIPRMNLKEGLGLIYRFRNQINRGPFPNRHEMILASLRRELRVFARMKRIGEDPPDDSYYDMDEIIEYLEMTIKNIEEVPRPTSPEFFSLNHNDLNLGLNIMVRGGKVAALIDWESASYDPFFLCVSDLTTRRDFNPRVWWEHSGPNGQNFHVLPYRLDSDPMEELLIKATLAGAERKPFPDWQLIDNNGGPLNEEDFCGDNYPEDISSDDDESIVDAAEIHCDSDADAEEEFIPRGVPKHQDLLIRRQRPVWIQELLTRRWYYEPVYALMKEFIHRQRGAGLGPDGEWGKLPEEYSGPFADWEDSLFMNVARTIFEGRRDQIIEPDRVYRVVDKAAKVPASTHNVPTGTQNVQPKTHKSPKRQRRVPAHISTAQSGTLVRARIAPESPVSSSRSAYLARHRPRRARPHLPPTTRRKTGRNHDPVPVSMFQRAWEPRRVKQGTEMDHPLVEAQLSDNDVLVNRVRGSIIAKAMEKLRVRLDSGAGVP
ncbi:hypothetical protein HOY82DRAFT_590279 [Tuber indicum]|nr:hypothetical protein HOY82DRAFT_590279 [Tuber indicum]